MAPKARPLRRYGYPAYPTRLDVLDDPALLRQHIPSAWLNRAEMAGAMTLFLAANCNVRSGSKATARTGPDSPAVVAPGKAAARIAPDSPAVVAPIFEHGDGRGAVGCVVVSPPAFLSEEEALSVIDQELGAVRLHLSRRSVVLPEVRIPQRRHTCEDANGLDENDLAETGRGAPLAVYRLDADRTVAIRFVSEQAYGELGGPASCSTVQGYDFEERARDVASRVRDSGKGILLGVFYDPSADPTPAQESAGRELRRQWVAAREKKTQEEIRRKVHDIEQLESKRLLRLQVKDFIEWLKGQGAI